MAQHPGILLQRRIEDANTTANRIAIACGVPCNRLTRIVNGEIGVTPDTAVRIATWFGDDPVAWLKVQAEYDVAVTRERLAAELKKLQRRDARR
jgi:addiction module HigA family antidote